MSGSGGGSSGTVVYPAYMATIHGKWLDGSGGDTPDLSMVTAINNASGNSPFASAVAYDPTAQIDEIDGTLTTLIAYIVSLNHVTDYTNATNTTKGIYTVGSPLADVAVVDGTPTADAVVPADMVIAATSLIVSDQDISDDMAALDAVLGAVSTSSFIIGEAIMRGMKSRDVAKHGSTLRIALNTQKREIDSRSFLQKREIENKNFMQGREINSRYFIQRREIETQYFTQKRELTLRSFMGRRDLDLKYYIHRQELVKTSAMDMMNILMKIGDLQINKTHMIIEANRVKAVMGKEEVEEQLNIDESDHKWDMEVFKYGANLLAAPSGGVSQGNDKKSKAVSALGGALSGAAAGGMVAGPYGAAAGAVLGVGMSFLA